MSTLSESGWRDIVDQSPEGIVVCDATAADCPVVYANAAFLQLSGYPLTALMGRNLRLLQGSDRDQEGRQRIREALSRGEACRVLMRNYRPDGAQYWNEILIQPVRDASGQLVQWIGYHRDTRARLRTAEKLPLAGLPAWMREDRLTGLHSRAYFEELLQRDWNVAQREGHEIGLTLLDIDDLGTYNDIFDKASGDACIRRVARVITGSYRRSGDLIGRWNGGTFAVLTQANTSVTVDDYARVVLQRVRDLLIHHPRATASGRYVTLSAGACTLVPPRELSLAAFVNACSGAMRRAKGKGKNTACATEAADFEPSHEAAIATQTAGAVS
ncbi:MAG TPA: diguanylate cyclase [Steroidobacteraceae bacterium]|jgi:diguanylate cyclase (GGDEF)-like protein/PAS domain S-box-containing protein|nr:diguanylate cyclase [Steroidobacteraceae bacterium]